MDGRAILRSFFDEFVGRVLSSPTVPLPSRLEVSPWLAMSLLQKSIRRGEEDFALAASSTLLETSPNRLWRRLLCIAFEDIGPADLNAVGSLTAALGTAAARRALAPWQLAASATLTLARAAKCRATDDLLMAAAGHPRYAADRRAMVREALPSLLKASIAAADPTSCAIALICAVGASDRIGLPARSGDARRVFDLLCEVGQPQSLVEVCREGFRRTREPLCALMALLPSGGVGATEIVNDDAVPPAVLVAGVPGWAFDQYSREGLAALRLFLKRATPTSRWIGSHVPPPEQVRFLGGLVFRVEGGLLRRRVRWPWADDLRWRYERECAGSGCVDATEPMGLLRNDLIVLNEVRTDAR